MVAWRGWVRVVYWVGLGWWCWSWSVSWPRVYFPVCLMRSRISVACLVFARNVGLATRIVRALSFLSPPRLWLWLLASPLRLRCVCLLCPCIRIPVCRVVSFVSVAAAAATGVAAAATAAGVSIPVVRNATAASCTSSAKASAVAVLVAVVIVSSSSLSADSGNGNQRYCNIVRLKPTQSQTMPLTVTLIPLRLGSAERSSPHDPRVRLPYLHSYPLQNGANLVAPTCDGTSHHNIDHSAHECVVCLCGRRAARELLPAALDVLRAPIWYVPVRDEDPVGTVLPHALA